MWWWSAALLYVFLYTNKLIAAYGVSHAIATHDDCFSFDSWARELVIVVVAAFKLCFSFYCRSFEIAHQNVALAYVPKINIRIRSQNQLSCFVIAPLRSNVDEWRICVYILFSSSRSRRIHRFHCISNAKMCERPKENIHTLFVFDVSSRFFGSCDVQNKSWTEKRIHFLVNFLVERTHLIHSDKNYAVSISINCANWSLTNKRFVLKTIRSDYTAIGKFPLKKWIVVRWFAATHFGLRSLTHWDDVVMIE